MDESAKFRICSQRLQRVKELRRIKGLPDVIMDDVEEEEASVPTNYVKPTFKPCYPNLKPKAQASVINPITESTQSSTVKKQLESPPMMSAKSRCADSKSNAEGSSQTKAQDGSPTTAGTQVEISTSTSVQDNVRAAASESSPAITNQVHVPAVSNSTVNIAQLLPPNPSSLDIAAVANQSDGDRPSDVKEEEAVGPCPTENLTSDHAVTSDNVVQTLSRVPPSTRLSEPDGGQRCPMKRKMEDLPNHLGVAMSVIKGKSGRPSEVASASLNEDTVCYL